MSASHNLSLFFESLDLSKERLELLLEAFYPMLKAAFCISLPLAVISFIGPNCGGVLWFARPWGLYGSNPSRHYCVFF